MKDGMTLAVALININKATNEQALLADRLTSKYTVIAWKAGRIIRRAFNLDRVGAWDVVERAESAAGNVTVYVYKNGSKKHCFKSAVSNKPRIIH